MIYGPRFSEALVFAAALHRDQVRKGSGIPYVTHLLATAALTGEADGTEDEVIAALLHDAIEDQGGRSIEQTIEKLFGPVVARLVRECSDTDITPKPPWKARKEAYLIHLENASDSACKISCADKIHNAKSTLRDLRNMGLESLQRFNAPEPKIENILWYYESLLSVFQKRKVHPRLTAELSETLGEIRRLLA